MIYQGFAAVYDEVMSEAPYELWTSFIVEAMKAEGSSGGRQVLDVACGTGEITTMLYKLGFATTGIDISAEMLAAASRKAMENNQDIPFFQQDMRELQGVEDTFDAVCICCDSLNYLETREDVVSALTGAFNALKKGGVLIFDVHSEYKINEIYLKNTFADSSEDISYIWNSFKGEFQNSVEHELSFFVRSEEGFYERFDETHYQRTFSVSDYLSFLKNAGFSGGNVSADFQYGKQPDKLSERIFFTAAK
ncbi:methyltransferase domain-containing protein [Bacillus lacus]|uniref:Methyltransferase domain-containing protein n=1 Tax=Metabacillus lacus TaxID=1983721 RepID=A0A7X2IX91_9BACI|nr:class I SAM-dependent methyltransferase [Metabacillus lacus]MRX71335.1 methyltransferase domain-containing protein [Metabacillus lacus]